MLLHGSPFLRTHEDITERPRSAGARSDITQDEVDSLEEIRLVIVMAYLWGNAACEWILVWINIASKLVAGRAKEQLGLSAVLLRPDGFVAWAEVSARRAWRLRSRRDRHRLHATGLAANR